MGDIWTFVVVEQRMATYGVIWPKYLDKVVIAYQTYLILLIKDIMEATVNDTRFYYMEILSKRYFQFLIKLFIGFLSAILIQCKTKVDVNIM